MSLCLGNLLPPSPLQEAMKASDGSLLGDPGRIPLGKREGIKWQRPRFTRQAMMRCCLIKWILSSAAPQGSGRTRMTGGQRETVEIILSSSVFSEATLGHTASTSVGKRVSIHSQYRTVMKGMGTADQDLTQVFQRVPGR